MPSKIPSIKSINSIIKTSRINIKTPPSSIPSHASLPHQRSCQDAGALTAPRRPPQQASSH
ncbi:hypothetical protein E2C01_014861 [Portunus trituberculatus]|uniref:Uncharacterized protein n=1 Tax=Portunus trituberculatus TaxID=210409 RepID=A0A5B7DKA5_PORTR|nr:hypothetical protein [Portunus trituberculatus]